MTIHNSKGKKFDEVIIWEDQFRSIVPPNASTQEVEETCDESGSNESKNESKNENFHSYMQGPTVSFALIF